MREAQRMLNCKADKGWPPSFRTGFYFPYLPTAFLAFNGRNDVKTSIRFSVPGKRDHDKTHMTRKQMPPDQSVVNRCAMGGAITFSVLNFATGVVPGGMIGGAIGGVLGAIVGTIINAINPTHAAGAAQPASGGGGFHNTFAFIGLLVILLAGASIGGAWWAGIHVPPTLTNPEQIKQYKLAYWDQFRSWYLPIIVPGSIFIAALIAFGRRSETIVIAGAISVLFYFSEKSTVKRDLARPGHPIPFPVVGQPIAASPSIPDGLTPQQRAVKLFPELGVANSKLNQEFVRRYKQYQAQNPAYFYNPEWPTQLARESQLAPGMPNAGAVLGPELALPANGETKAFTWGTALAPFQIKSSAGTNYLLKLIEVGSGKLVMTIFVCGGNTVNVKVPPDTYILKYAAGNKWYGYHYLFGPNTSYNQASGTVSFRGDGAQIKGKILVLYKVPNGNFHTEAISASKF